ncbi:unnamed protein product [Boreogadus saida]
MEEMKRDHREEGPARNPRAMTFSFGSTLRSNHGLKSWCRQMFSEEMALSTPMGLLRRFLLLKQVTVLLSPRCAMLPLVVGCVISMKALLLLRSPHISTKPSSVFLRQLALAGLLPLPYLALRLALTTLDLAVMEAAAPGGVAPETAGRWVWWWRSCAVPCVLAEKLLDAHLLASLILLGLLGLEGVLVSRWPLQTRGLRTARYAQLSCGLVWVVVLLELLLPEVDFRWTAGVMPVTRTDDVSVSYGLALPNSSLYLRKALWVVNVWFHYFAIYCRPQKRDGCFH